VGDVARIVREGTNGLILRERTAEGLADAVARVLTTDWTPEVVAASVAEYSADRIATAVSGMLREATGSTN
jgi:hypothetical protein